MLLGKLKVIGHSMEPALKNNDVILISSILYLFKYPQINDIVAFRFNNKILIKRISKNIENKYFLEGDNSSDSYDSRKFGLIFRKDILGKVIFKLN